MSLSKKIAGASAAGGSLALVGYGVVTAVNKSEEAENERKLDVKLTASKLKKLSLEKDKKTPIGEINSVMKILDKFYKNPNENQVAKRNRWKEDCQKLSKKPESENSLFKDFIQKCTKLKSFKTRAEDLSLNPLSELGTNAFKNKLSDLRNPIDQDTKESKFKEILQKETDSEEILKKYCQTVEVLTSDTFSSTDELEKEWSVYMKLCLPKDTASKDYWTGK